MELFNSDIQNAITALECLIIDHEESAIKNNYDDLAWQRIEELKRTRENFKLLKSIYGG